MAGAAGRRVAAIRFHPSSVWRIVKQTLHEWREDDGAPWGAALAYYAVFSIAPVLLIGISVAGYVFGASHVERQVLLQAEALVGPEGASLLEQMIDRAGSRGGSVWATAIGAGALLLGATGVFIHLKVALNRMWDVRSTQRGVRGFVRARLLAFAMVAVIGFLLLVSLLASAALALLDEWLVGISVRLFILLRAASVLASFSLVTLLFACIFRVLPDVDVEWRDVWWGAAATALLFTAGKWAIGLYLGNSGAASAYGAAGALVVILLWVYYSSQILLLGAELTQVYARMRGRRFGPDAGAVSIP